MTAFVADTDVVGVVGPFNSGSAKAQIPVSNEAGLFQCSPSNTSPTLTIGEDGKTLRAANPDKINYVRLCSNDNFQGGALAKYAYTTLGLRSALVIDDTETYGKGLADVFAENAWLYTATYTKSQLQAGGKVTLRAGLTGFDITFPVLLYGAGGIYNTVITFDTSIAILTGGA
jgi:ABC-type branched-subunit amino acid transport system substrate-binding protein